MRLDGFPKQLDLPELPSLPDKFTGALRTTAPPRVLAANGRAMSREERADLLEQLKAGKHVELDVEIIPSRCRCRRRSASSRTRTFPGFTASASRALSARSRTSRSCDATTPQGTILAKGGTLAEADYRRDDDGGYLFVQRAHLVEDWAVRGVLNGTIKEFSIGWMWRGGTWRDLKKALQCSVCRTSLFGSDCEGPVT